MLLCKFLSDLLWITARSEGDAVTLFSQRDVNVDDVLFFLCVGRSRERLVKLFFLNHSALFGNFGFFRAISLFSSSLNHLLVVLNLKAFAVGDESEF